MNLKLLSVEPKGSPRSLWSHGRTGRRGHPAPYNQSQRELPFFFFKYLFIYLFIYLAASCLSCGTQGLCCGARDLCCGAQASL